MCGRYASSRRDDELRAELDVDEVVGEPLPASWNVAPTQDARVVVDRPSRDQPDRPPVRQLRTMRWGLVPSWSTDARAGSRLINARAETVTTKPAYRAAARTRRCLVPADGYYEWERRADGPTVPTYLSDGGRLLTFAGLYGFWRASGDDDWLVSFTVVTRPAPDALGHIHDRSPVLLDGSLRDAWLDPTITDPTQVRGLLAAAPDPALETWEVSRAVSSYRNDGPGLVERV